MSGISPQERQSKTNARLATVQALYQLNFATDLPDEVMLNFLAGKIGGQVINEDLETGEERFVPLPDFDKEMFTSLFKYATQHIDDIGEIIQSNLDEKVWPMSRLEPVLKAVLTAGIAELYINNNTDTPVIINEYLDIANSFYEGEAEASLTNAVLDKIAKVIKSQAL